MFEKAPDHWLLEADGDWQREREREREREKERETGNAVESSPLASRDHEVATVWGLEIPIDSQTKLLDHNRLHQTKGSHLLRGKVNTYSRRKDKCIFGHVL